MKQLLVHVLTSSADRYQEKPGVIRLNIAKNNLNLHHQSYLDLFRFFWKSTIWTLKHKNNYDLIHAFSGLPGSLTAWLSGRPYLVSFRGADEPGYESRHNLLWKIIKPLMGVVYRRARSLDANSFYLKNLVLKSWPDLKIQVIRNGVDTNQFRPAAKKVKDQMILCTSRLAPRKGVEDLIRAVALLPQVKLILVGGGQLEDRIKLLVNKLRLVKRVKFVGALPHHRLSALYRQAKLFVLPSLSESQSNSLLEALASGLPVVATNVGGNPEVVNADNGLLVAPADSTSLAGAITEAMDKSWRIKRVNFSWNRSAQTYSNLYHRLQ